MPVENDIAVILIHGIGDLEPHDVLSSAAKGIRRSRPDIHLSDTEIPSGRTRPVKKGEAYVDTLNLDSEGGRVRLTEFYWAQIPGKIRARHPLRALWQILGTLREFPSMSVGESTSPRFARLATYCGFFQQAMVMLALVLSLIFVADGFRKAPDSCLPNELQTISALAARDLQGTFTPDDTKKLHKALGQLWTDYPLLLVLVCLSLFTTVAWIVLMAGCFVFPVVALAGPRKWHHFGILWRTLTASALLMMLAIWTIFFLAEGALLGVNEIALAYEEQTTTATDFPLAAVIGVLMFVAIGKAGLIAANLLRDVIHYLATDRKGPPLPVQQKIQAELWDVIQRHQEHGRIILIAHSLGTVIVADLLRRHVNAPQHGEALHIDIVTAGSPLRRLIYRFLPNRLPSPVAIFSELTKANAFKLDRWLNVYRILDYVGQRLTTRSDPPGQIIDQPLKPRYCLPFGHANYWQDPRFLNFIAAKVIVPIAEDARYRSTTQ